MADGRNTIREAAELLISNWKNGGKLDGLPQPLKPASREAGYAVAAAIAEQRGETVVGWKIAATGKAGQAHINVDGPLAGRLYESRVLPAGSTITMGANLMKVAEVEFAFRFARALPRRGNDYSQSEVMDAVESLHLSIEVPDSRYCDFTKVGAPSLIADTACADWLVLGPAVQADWRKLDLAAFVVAGKVNGAEVAKGKGEAVLGDPRIALTWLVNEVRRYCGDVAAGAVVTTGTCIVPAAIKPGEAFTADYGPLGEISVKLG